MKITTPKLCHLRITNLWCSYFIIPNQCISQINSMCSAYLWKGSLEGRHVVRIAWDTVTTPKDEGRLGIKNLQVYNHTCALKLLWLILFRTESIWVAWICQNEIKDANIWTMKSKQSHTWIFEQILKQRPIASQWFRSILGNGRCCSFWFNPWIPLGPLISFVGATGPRQTGILITATVLSVWRWGHWILPPVRSRDIESMLIHITSIALSDAGETSVWTVEGVVTTTFNTNQIFHLIRERPLVTWASICWFKCGVPKHQFLAWLFLHNRCPTKDRMIRWGISIDPSCLLCNSGPESRDHLFFECSYSRAAWNILIAGFRLPRSFNRWDETIDGLLTYTSNNRKGTCYYSFGKISFTRYSMRETIESTGTFTLRLTQSVTMCVS